MADLVEGPGHGSRERFPDRRGLLDRVSDVPWGVLVLVTVVVLVAVHRVSGEEAQGLATAAGLLGIGHGLHTGARNLRRR